MKNSIDAFMSIDRKIYSEDCDTRIDHALNWSGLLVGFKNEDFKYAESRKTECAQQRAATYWELRIASTLESRIGRDDSTLA